MVGVWWWTFGRVGGAGECGGGQGALWRTHASRAPSSSSSAGSRRGPADDEDASLQ